MRRNRRLERPDLVANSRASPGGGLVAAARNRISDASNGIARVGCALYGNIYNMRNLTAKVAASSALAVALLFPFAASAQTTDNGAGGTGMSTSNTDHTNYWPLVGLLGLAGLAGLRRRPNDTTDSSRTIR